MHRRRYRHPHGLWRFVMLFVTLAGLLCIGLSAWRLLPLVTTRRSLAKVDFSLVSVETAPRVFGLHGRMDRVTNADLAEAMAITSRVDPRLIRVERLRLQNTRITDDGLRHLGLLSSLRHVDVSETRVTDDGLKYLSNLPHLEVLNVAFVDSLDGSGLHWLKSNPRLVEINLRGTHIEDRYMPHVMCLSRLEVLDLGVTPVTDLGTRKIEALLRLVTLELDVTQISDASVARVSTLARLQHLSLRDNVAVTDASVKHLATMRALRYLDITGTAITDNGYRTLIGQLPSCRVNRTQ
jgi:hypothetical protein